MISLSNATRGFKNQTQSLKLQFSNVTCIFKCILNCTHVCTTAKKTEIKLNVATINKEEKVKSYKRQQRERESEAHGQLDNHTVIHREKCYRNPHIS